MTHIENEIKQLKDSVIEMWNLVLSQLHRAKECIEENDENLANEIIINEKKIDAYELKINMDCENILALFNPVANDLRFILSVIRINADLERIGDYARSIAKIIREEKKSFSKESLEKTNISGMLSVAINMLSNTLTSFENENKNTLQFVFKSDSALDKINKHANEIITELIKKYPDQIPNHLNLLSIIRRIERMGDQTKAIAEEIVFYLEAKVLRHQKKKDKLI